MGRVKLAGTAQRLVSRAWLCAASVVVTGAAEPCAVLVEVNRQLGFEWCPSTFGAVTDLVPTATVADVEDAMVAAFGAAADGAAGTSEASPTGAGPTGAGPTSAAGVEAAP